MPRTVLDQELRDLNAQIMQLGSLADDALAKETTGYDCRKHISTA